MTTPQYRTLGSRGVSRSKIDIDDLVGQTLFIRRVTIGESFQFQSPYAELLVDVVDDLEAGTVSDSGLLIVSFGRAIVRTLDDWLTEEEYGVDLVPPLAVLLRKDGRTHVLLDIGEELPSPRRDEEERDA